MLKNEKDVIEIIEEDEEMMEILRAAKTLNLPDWWVCAGFVRSKIWDTLHGFPTRTPLPDVDVIYFDPENIDEQHEKELEAKLCSILPETPWSVKNQARMHKRNNLPPYKDSVDAMSKFPETATALGAKLNEEGEVILAAPCGIEDAIQLQVKPTTFFTETTERTEIYEQRIHKKNWKAIWHKLEIHHP
ncbi:nucleotidyltransferase family protein [Evansella sp. AB-P1]|uniref:nucleotidyltransferase family protein n=1 Tax=Evansella sp. AB-P1 TaxID=3037653 RepID=UPI00241CAF13|nr:nucleotidyltransferase family protein [Evansella sp. AB-P1]MDG5789256.1 nucleotidyltransferase family protein [Evansella sp. AB-P1]